MKPDLVLVICKLLGQSDALFTNKNKVLFFLKYIFFAMNISLMKNSKLLYFKLIEQVLLYIWMYIFELINLIIWTDGFLSIFFDNICLNELIYSQKEENIINISYVNIN